VTAMEGTKAVEATDADTVYLAAVEPCPRCGSDDTERRHHEATFAVPECDYKACNKCEHQWGHE